GFDELADVFREQAIGLIRGGVDVLLIETSQDILEVKAAITGIHKAFDETQVYLPIQAQVTLDTTGRMLLGTDVAAALAILEGMGIDVIGLNCSTGPEHMREPIRILTVRITRRLSLLPPCQPYPCDRILRQPSLARDVTRKARASSSDSCSKRITTQS